MQNSQDPRGAESGGAPQKRRKKHKRNPVLHGIAVFFKVIGTLLLVGATTGAILACFAAVFIKTEIMPNAYIDLGEMSMDVTLSSTMYYNDENGTPQELRGIYGTSNRVWVKYADIPQDLINATIAIEDKRFEDHHGVDWIRTASSVLTMFTGGNIQGGSTITQQLIKNLTTDDEVTVQRKILEIFRALEFEKDHTKAEIMEWYLNYIYLGERCNGVYTASYAYFGKDVSELTLAECASLISITNNPSMYDPYLSQESNTKRALTVLDEMLKQGRISQARHDDAAAELKAGLNFAHSEEEEREETVYTWYEDQVLKDVINGLMDAGYSELVASNMVYYGGLKIYTCLDPKVQEAVDAVYQDMGNLPYTSSSGQQLQSGITVVDPNGYVVALSGGMGEKEGNRIFSRATTMRAPGSAFKPLSVYAPAIDMGLITPNSVLDDVPFSINNGDPYPNNSYNYYKGRMSVKEGVYLSSNPLAMRALVLLMPQASFDFLTTRLGFSNLVEREEINNKVMSDIDLAPLALGGLTKGVSTLEMAGAFATFPRNGAYLAPITFTQVKDSKGNVILDNTSERVPVPVIKETTAYYMNSLMKNVVNPNISGATGKNAYFEGMTIAGKTGSTNSNRDRWFVGYTPYYTAAVWCGFDQQERIRVEPNTNPAAVLWGRVMSQVHTGLEDKDFPKPDGLTEVSICADSGLRATDRCSMDPRGGRVTSGYFFPGDAPSQYCTIHDEVEFPEGSMVTVCLDDPILDSNGNPTGMFHIAREFCPEDRRSTIYLLNVEREGQGSAYQARDAAFTVKYYKDLGESAFCTIHTEVAVYDPLTFNPVDPMTWPTKEQWPDFDPLDETTWPNYVPPGNGDEPLPEPSPGLPGETTPPVETVGPTLPPTEEPVNGGEVPPTEQPTLPSEEPFIPAA